jgi:hypothetical protein
MVRRRAAAQRRVVASQKGRSLPARCGERGRAENQKLREVWKRMGRRRLARAPL